MFGRLSLRVRLLLGVLVLAAAVLAAADTATSRALHSFLIQRTDNSLDSAHREVEAALNGNRDDHGGRRGGGPPPDDSGPSTTVLGRLVHSNLAGLFVETRTASGRVVFHGQVPQFARTTTTPPAPRLPDTITLHRQSGSADLVSYFTVPAVSGGGSYRVRASEDPGSTTRLIIATPLNGINGTLHRLFLIELIVSGAGLAAILLLGLWTVRLALRPLDAISRAAAAIGGGDLGTRIARAEPRTEVGRLGLALNAMLGQIETAFQARAASESRMRRFVADASHELRNPIAAVRAYAELADQRVDDRERAIAGISREAERMGLLVEELLLLAHLDEGRPLERKPVELDELVFEAVETARTLEPDRPIELDVEHALVEGDRDRLRRVIDNLLSNARAHTPPDTRVRVSVKTDGPSAVLTVADDGPGIPESDLERVFERFYRADATRRRTDGGAGLGLSIVGSVTKAHGGTASVGSEPGRGATFTITLPLAR